MVAKTRPPKGKKILTQARCWACDVSYVWVGTRRQIKARDSWKCYYCGGIVTKLGEIRERR